MKTAAFIQSLRSRLRAVIATDYSCRFMVVAGTTLFYIGMLDFLTTYGYIPLIPPFPWALRLILLLGWLALIGALTFRRFLRPMLQDFSDVNLARIAERRLPGIDGRIFTELDGIALGEADRRDLDGMLDSRAIGQLVPASRMRGLVRAACAVFLGILGWTWYYPGHVQTAVRNFFTLRNDFPMNTTLHAALADRVVPENRSLVVRLLRGGEEAPIELVWRDERGLSDARDLAAHRTKWNEAFDLPAGTYRLTASAGVRANAVDLKGWVVRRPDVGAIASILTPPGYVADKVPVQTIHSLAAKAVLPGTTCAFTIDLADEGNPDDPELVAQSAVSVQVNGLAIPFQRNGRRLTGHFVIMQQSEIAVDLVTSYQVQDGAAYAIGAEPEERFTVTVEEDTKPSVQIDGLRTREEVGPKAVIDLGVSAVDDYGLARLALLHQIINAKGTAIWDDYRTLLEFVGILGRTETTQGHVLDLTSDGLAPYAVPGNIIELVAEAADANDVTGPGVGRSIVVQVPIITEEELQTKLDNILHDARERIHDARNHLGKGLLHPETLRESSRNAQVAARRSNEALAIVRRRWQQNRLKETMQQILDEAHQRMDTEAMPQLATAAFEQGDTAQEAAQAAETSLSEIEDLLGRMLRSDDLERELKNLRLKQQALTEKSRKHALASMTAQTAGNQEQGKQLVDEQKALADALKQWERKLDANKSTSPAFEKARETVRNERPSDRLERAVGMLGAQGEQQQAVDQQDEAGKTMSKLLDQLQGGRKNEAIAKEFRKRAGQEENMANRMDAGDRPQDLETEQREVDEQIQELLKDLDEKEPAQGKAKENAEAARQAMDAAAKAMAQGKGQQAASEANAAAGLLRQAAEELEGKDQKPKPEQPPAADILALLRELKTAQAAILREATVLHGKMVATREAEQRDPDDPKLDFFEIKSIKKLAEDQAAVLLRLREEGIKELEKNRIAKLALVRVETAVQRAADHLATPALQTRGHTLIKLAYYRIARLLEVAENLPELEKETGGQGQQPGQGGNQAPFPPRAVIALLIEDQFQIARGTAANRFLPGDLLTAQKDVLESMAYLVEHMRPGSRPELLLKRALRAGSSAAFELDKGRRGTVCRNEMDAAIMALQRLLEEGKQQGGGQSQDQPKPKPQHQQGQDQSQQQQADKGQSPGPQAGGNPGGNDAGGAGGETVVTETAQQNSAVMQLRAEMRERLLEPATLKLSPGAYLHYQSYLEYLESRE